MTTPPLPPDAQPLNRYWSDRDYQVQCRIEADHQNALNNAAIQHIYLWKVTRHA